MPAPYIQPLRRTRYHRGHASAHCETFESSLARANLGQRCANADANRLSIGGADARVCRLDRQVCSLCLSASYRIASAAPRRPLSEGLPCSALVLSTQSADLCGLVKVWRVRGEGRLLQVCGFHDATVSTLMQCVSRTHGRTQESCPCHGLADSRSEARDRCAEIGYIVQPSARLHRLGPRVCRMGSCGIL